MQRDNLERFILNNRTDFDQEMPSLKVWAEIDKQMKGGGAKRVSLWRSVRIAAAVAALLFIGALAGTLVTKDPALTAEAKLQEIAPEFGEMERFYNQQIQQQFSRLANYQYEPTVLDDLEQVDDIMDELKQELANAPQGTEEKIIENLIKTYQTKVAILGRVLERIQSTNRKDLKPEDNEISI